MDAFNPPAVEMDFPSAPLLDDARQRRRVWWMAAVIVILGLAAYCNSFSGQFVFDDAGSLSNNHTLRSLWRALSPPKGAETVSGRPVLNFSFAVDYAVHGLSITGLHVGNLAIHLLGGLALLGVVRRTLLMESMKERFGDVATWVGGVVALVWVVHPLQTESVTYVVQRAESLSGLLYLLSMYCFVRGVESQKSARWMGGAVVACLLGIGTKETLVSAPVIVLLYDRAFVSGSFAEALRRRWRVHLAMATTTWAALVCLMLTNLNRGGTAGVGLSIGMMDYARTQVGAIAMYLKLSVWPRPLVLDYGVGVAKTWGEVAGAAVVVGSIVTATVWALWKRPKVGFAMAMFFACLAPTSSIVPVTTQTMAEHRMYLALAAEIGLVTVGVWMAWEKVGRSITGGWQFAPFAAACLFAVVLAFMTFNRNRDYQSPLGMWLDTVAKRPTNARAYNGVGQALKDMRRYEEALVFYSQSIEVEPRTAKWHCNRGNCYYAMQEFSRAIADYDNALRLDPNLKGAYANRSASHFFLREYDLAWDDVRRAVEHGAKPHPDFLKALTRASGRAIDPALANLPIENE